MAAKHKNNVPLERREELEKRDLDRDQERGEPKAHQMKVLGKAAMKGKKVCPLCKKAGKTSCSH